MERHRHRKASSVHQNSRKNDAQLPHRLQNDRQTHPGKTPGTRQLAMR
ncbi:hypothetical protein RE6C_02805 [Rhodopirellula europaea 6C]|uniref:Uncharacterized protein n=1 Tax=Rhodopirellula europaea 6C TaxID=1263867 RepID=M2AH32_9BACT|nr:hypothetical protein RE6C_02805 [Rhodopirellula europaea 6C]